MQFEENTPGELEQIKPRQYGHDSSMQPQNLKSSLEMDQDDDDNDAAGLWMILTSPRHSCLALMQQF